MILEAILKLKHLIRDLV